MNCLFSIPIKARRAAIRDMTPPVPSKPARVKWPRAEASARPLDVPVGLQSVTLQDYADTTSANDRVSMQVVTTAASMVAFFCYSGRHCGPRCRLGRRLRGIAAVPSS
jgi:hypothetical protein